jgi:hypothetical protein
VRIADLEVRELTTVDGRHYAGLVHAAVHHAMKAARWWSSGRIGWGGSVAAYGGRSERNELKRDPAHVMAEPTCTSHSMFDLEVIPQ